MRHPSRRLRVGAVQAGCAGVGLVLAPLTTAVSWEPRFPASIAAPVMLTVAFSIVGLVTIIFSLLFTVVQWVSSTFSLRLRRFETNPLTWWVFGITIGIFVYSIAAAVLAVRAQEVSWVVVTVTFVATLAALIMMRQVQMRAFSSIQLGSTLQELCAEGLTVVADNYPESADDTESTPPEPVTPDRVPGKGPVELAADVSTTDIVWQGPPTTLQAIDEAALISQLDAVGASCRLTVRVGEFLVPGLTVARVSNTDRLKLGRIFITGQDRTAQQDVLLQLRLLADIGLKALSPAINDPATAVQAMDALAPILNLLAVRELAIGELRGRDGTTVAQLLVPTWDEMLAEALDDLVPCAAALPTAARRLDRLLGQLHENAIPSRRAAVEERQHRLRAACANLSGTLAS